MLFGKLKNDRVVSIKSAPITKDDLKNNEVKVPNRNVMFHLYQNGSFVSDAETVSRLAVRSEKIKPEKRVSSVDFKLLFTGQERVAIKKSTDDSVKEFVELLADVRLTSVGMNTPAVTEALDHMVTLGIITETRKGEILG